MLTAMRTVKDVAPEITPVLTQYSISFVTKLSVLYAHADSQQQLHDSMRNWKARIILHSTHLRIPVRLFHR
jgi:hypothetical protein